MMTEASVFSNKFVISLYDLKLFLPYVVTVDQLPFVLFSIICLHHMFFVFFVQHL